MPSTPSSPTAPSHRRRPARLPSFEFPGEPTSSPYAGGVGTGTTFSRRSSRTSQTLPSPTTPRLISSRSSRPNSYYHRRKSSSRLSVGSNISINPSDGGMGNLADELEDALEDEYETQHEIYLESEREGNTDTAPGSPRSPHNVQGTHLSDSIARTLDAGIESGVHLSSAVPDTKTSNAEKRKSRHQRTESKYDGSDYGPESDLDDDGFPPMLAKRMRDIESLTRMSTNTEDTLSEGGGVVRRTVHALQDLGPQSSIENSLSRIITAYTSMATHRTHKTRDLFSQAHSLLYGNVLELPEEVIDVLLEEIETLASTIPFLPQQNPLISLQILASQTLEVAQTLRGLTDVLQESRITANAASRKLKSVKDMVDDFRMDEDLVEESMMLIQAGDWDRRCRERKAAATCREVVEGFGKKWGLEVETKPWTGDTNIAVS